MLRATQGAEGLHNILSFEQQLLATPGLKVPEWLQKTRQVGYKVCWYARPARPAVCAEVTLLCRLLTKPRRAGARVIPARVAITRGERAERASGM